MRKTIRLAATAMLLVGLAACGTSKPPALTSATPSAPQAPATAAPVRSSDSTPANGGGGDMPASCPTRKDFEQAANDAERQAAQITGAQPSRITVQLTSDVACKIPIAGARIKEVVTSRSQSITVADGIMIVRWKYWQLTELNLPRSAADKRWAEFDVSRQFPAIATVCEDSPIIDWLRSQGSCVN